VSEGLAYSPNQCEEHDPDASSLASGSVLKPFMKGKPGDAGWTVTPHSPTELPSLGTEMGPNTSFLDSDHHKIRLLHPYSSE
jgi:hypothetical protein